MDDKALHDAAALLGENYEDYAILIKSPSGGVWWRTSDVTWADGAMRRFQRSKDVRDREEDVRRLED